MKIDRLDRALSKLVEEGSISSEQGALLRSTYIEIPEERDSQRSIFAEIGGYLGGSFIVISALFFTANWWDELSGITRTLIFAVLSLILSVIALNLGDTSPVRQRLSSVLAMAAAVSATSSVIVYQELNDVPFFAFLTGALLASYFFFQNRHEILHIGTYGYLFFTIFTLVIFIYGDSNDGPQPLLAVVWSLLAAVWIYLSSKGFIQKLLGYLLASATLFISIQFLFLTDNRLASYLLAITTVLGLARLFMVERSWPLLVGAITITTFSVGEFVAATLGGSLGALLGLFTAGLALITSSLVALRKLHRQ